MRDPAQEGTTVDRIKVLTRTAHQVDELRRVLMRAGEVQLAADLSVAAHLAHDALRDALDDRDEAESEARFEAAQEDVSDDDLVSLVLAYTTSTPEPTFDAGPEYVDCHTCHYPEARIKGEPCGLPCV